MWIHQKKYENLGRILAVAREKVGVTQEDLAKQLRKPQSFVSSYERGQRRVDLLEFARIADALGIGRAKLYAEIAKLDPL